MDLLRRRYVAEVLNINMSYPPEFRSHTAVKHVIGVAGVTGFVHRNTMILKMGGCDIVLIVNIKALAVRFHDVAGQTECSLLGFFEVL